MARKTKTAEKPATPAAKTPVKKLSDKEKVLEKYPDAECYGIKDGFCAFRKEGLLSFSLHSGIAKSESDSWKLAAHNL